MVHSPSVGPWASVSLLACNSMETVDRQRFPTLARYLELHGGRLDRYPNAQCKGVLLRDSLDSGKPLPNLEGAIPRALAAVINDPPPVNVWIPEMLSVAFYSLVEDLWFTTREEAQEWLFRKNLERMRSPLYRLLMAVVSPQMLLRGSATRYGAFHRGSEFTIGAVPGGADARMTYPENLYLPGARLGVEAPLRAVLVAANAPNATVTVVHHGPTEMLIEARWG